jgi:hypothetical protein
MFRPYDRRMSNSLLFATAVSALAACTYREEQNERFAERGVNLETPRSWSVSGFSETVFPRRLVAASYEVRRGDVEGDCGGRAAIDRLPRDGADLPPMRNYGLEPSRF